MEGSEDNTANSEPGPYKNYTETALKTLVNSTPVYIRKHHRVSHSIQCQSKRISCNVKTHNFQATSALHFITALAQISADFGGLNTELDVKFNTLRSCF